MELLFSVSAVVWGFVRPSPPCLRRRASGCLSASYTSCLTRVRMSRSLLVKYISHVRHCSLTLWEPAYKYIVPRFQPKTSSFRLPYQRPSSSADCARELFKGSNGLASLLVCTLKNFLLGGCGFFVSDTISEVVLVSFWLMLPVLGPTARTKYFAEVFIGN